MPKGSFKYHWRENEVKICHCYAEITKLSSEDFVKMVLLDSTYMKTMAYQVNYGWIGIYFRTRYYLRINFHFLFSRSCIINFLGLKKTIIFPLLCLLAKKFLPMKRKYQLRRKYKHFNDLIRYFYCPFWTSNPEKIFLIYSATKLTEAGVDSSFVVDEGTNGLFQNLMSLALEQCHYPSESYICKCNYIVLLDYLVNSAEDVELLVEKRLLAAIKHSPPW